MFMEELQDEVDLEALVKTNKPIPRARRYRIRVDKEQKVLESPTITGRQVLALVGKTPETHNLSERLRGGHVEGVPADKVVDLREPGVERFMTLPKDPTEGTAGAAA